MSYWLPTEIPLAFTVSLYWDLFLIQAPVTCFALGLPSWRRELRPHMGKALTIQ